MTSNSDARATGLGLRRLGRDVTMTVGRQVMIITVGLALTILLARLLGPSGNGQYVVAMLLPTVLATFLNLGVAPANVYFIGRGEVSARSALRATLFLWGLLSAVGCVLGVLIVTFAHRQWFHGVPIHLLWLATAAFPMLMLQTFVVSILQAREDFSRYNKAMLAAPLATLALAVAAVAVLHLGVVGAVIATVIGNASGLAVAYLAVKPHLHTGDECTPAYGWRCLGYGWKAHLSNVLTFFNYRADVFLLNYFLNPAAAGVYMVAVQVAERLWMLSQAVSTVVFPRLAGLHREEEKRKFLTPFIARWILLLSGCGALILVAVGKPLIRMLFGVEYTAATPALLWLVPGIVLGGSSRVLANDIAARGRPEFNLVIALVVVSVNIIGNIILIPKFGIVGASMATTLSYSVHAILTISVYSRMSGNKWIASIVVLPADWSLLCGAMKTLSNTRRATE